MCKIGYSPNEAAAAASIDVAHIHEALSASELKAHVIGGQAVIMSRDLKKWLTSQPELVPTRRR